MSRWHQMDVAAVVAELGSHVQRGLSLAEAEQRLAQHGPNELIESQVRGPWLMMWEQVSGALVVMLIVAAAVSAYLHEYTDTIVILAIVVLNAALGFVQDYRAEKALAALKKLAVPLVRVRRDGSLHEISARFLTAGDVILLEAGNYVPADCRLLTSAHLKVQESALTGESEAVDKLVQPLERPDAALGDRINMAYMGTVVTYGHGEAVVTDIGMNTELGNIASSLQSVHREATPLQKRLAQLGRTLALAAIGIVAVVFGLGVARGEDTRLMLMTALSLAVAVVPEGLPAVATVSLALGARRMFQRHALIRKLPAVETLGSVTVICSDKTGTLTENRMAVTVLDVAGDHIQLTAQIRKGASRPQDGDPKELVALRDQVSKNSALAMLLAGAALCNDSELTHDAEYGGLRAVGDPTDAALAVAAAHLGLYQRELLELFPRIAEAPFDSDRKRMTTLHRFDRQVQDLQPPLAQVVQTFGSLPGDFIAFSKGAVDSLVEVCGWVWDKGRKIPLDDAWRQRIAASNEELAARGMRVLGVALRPLDQAPDENSMQTIEADLVFVGVLGMIDPPRPEVRQAVARCRTAGIRPVMITGDHPLTATHIAQQLDIAQDGRVLTGQELEDMADSALSDAVEHTSVYARVAPKHKLRLVKLLQQKGEVVAMTGDGVNDAPALKQAHIGVAMGITGTDVAKEASQMVLLDDNFATIVNAVEQGRIVYDNIRKFVKYTMTSNSGEIWVMVLGPLLGMPLPLLPLQILWVNLVTDGLPGLALAVEQAERDTMRRPPYPPGEHIFGRGMGLHIAWVGLLMGAVSLSMGYFWWSWRGADDTHWRTLVFTVLTLAQMGHSLAVRSNRDSLFRVGLLSNKPLLASVLLTLGLQLLVVYWAPLQKLFSTQALSLSELVLCLALSTVVFWAVEVEKWIRRGRERIENTEMGATQARSASK